MRVQTANVRACNGVTGEAVRRVQNLRKTRWRTRECGIVEPTGELHGQEVLHRVEDGGDGDEENPFWEKALTLWEVYERQ
jgi:hypothetical protein